jgi:hypothetical protein
MAKSYKVNFTPTTGAEAMFELKNVLTGSGWTVVSSSNGTTLSSGDAVTSTSLANTRAWFLIEEPTGVGGRQWCFQRTTANTTWRVKISPNAGFSGGTPDSVSVPSATDQAVVVGSGTDASPTGGQLFGTDGAYKFHIIADNTAIGPAGNQAYGFWAFSNLIGNTNYFSNIATLIMQEPLAVGTYPALVGTRAVTTSGDADPAVYVCTYEASSRFLWFNGEQPGPGQGRLGGTSSDGEQLFKYYNAYQNSTGTFTGADEVLASSIQSSKYINVTPTTSEDVALPFNLGRQGTGVNGAVYFARTTNVGWKGATHFIRRRLTNRGLTDTINLSTNAYIYLYELLIPWPENVTPNF